MHSILKFTVLALVWTIAVSLPVGEESVDLASKDAPFPLNAPNAPVTGTAPVAPVTGNAAPAPSDLDTANTFLWGGWGYPYWGSGYGYGRGYGGWYGHGRYGNWW